MINSVNSVLSSLVLFQVLTLSILSKQTKFPSCKWLHLLGKITEFFCLAYTDYETGHSFCLEYLFSREPATRLLSKFVRHTKQSIQSLFVPLLVILLLASISWAAFPTNLNGSRQTLQVRWGLWNQFNWTQISLLLFICLVTDHGLQDPQL